MSFFPYLSYLAYLKNKIKIRTLIPHVFFFIFSAATLRIIVIVHHILFLSFFVVKRDGDFYFSNFKEIGIFFTSVISWKLCFLVIVKQN